MQSYLDIPETDSLTASRLKLINNTLTAMSCSSGTVFPTANLQVGMFCLRTDQNKLYQLKDATPTWTLIFDLAKTATDKEYVDAGLATKQPNLTGAATTIASSNLTVSRALASDASGKVAVSATTAAELGYLSGVTSAVQTQLNNRQPIDAFLTSIAALGTAADKLVYVSGVDTAAETPFNAAARLLLSDMKFSGLYGEKVNAMGSISGAQTIDNSLGTYVTATIAGATTFTFSNPVASGHCSGFVLLLTNGGAAGITWPTGTKWPSGVAPTLTASGLDVLMFITVDGGTTWRGSLTHKDSR